MKGLLQKMGGSSITIGVPTLAAVILACVGGVAQVINYSVVDASTQLHAAIAVGLLFLTGIGIPPITGSAFRAALHLPAWASYVISAAISAAMLALTTMHMAAGAHEAIAASLNVLSALGFSPAVEPVPVVTHK